MDRDDRLAAGQPAIPVMRNIEGRISTEELRSVLGNAVERQAAICETLSKLFDTVHEVRTDSAWYIGSQPAKWEESSHWPQLRPITALFAQKGEIGV